MFVGQLTYPRRGKHGEGTSSHVHIGQLQLCEAHIGHVVGA